MWEWLIGAGSSAITDHVSGRSANWWTGENSLWGKLTGGGDRRVTVSTARQADNPQMPPAVWLILAYLLVK